MHNGHVLNKSNVSNIVNLNINNIFKLIIIINVTFLIIKNPIYYTESYTSSF